MEGDCAQTNNTEVNNSDSKTELKNETTGTTTFDPNVNQDDLIIAQQQLIEKEISDNIPYVGAQEECANLTPEYKDDTVYKKKIQYLCEKYKFMRRTRPDGNCFFRAFAFAYFERLLTNKKEFEAFRQVAAGIKDKLVELGFPIFTIEDFHDTFMEVLDKVGSGVSVEELHTVFNDQGYSDYIVVFLRLVASGHLQKEAEFYANFIEGDRDVKEFCSQEVEPMYKESDHIHIIALSTALEVGIRVAYMDRGKEEELVAHNFPEDSSPSVHLLYRPGHYDILYLIETAQ